MEPGRRGGDRPGGDTNGESMLAFDPFERISEGADGELLGAWLDALDRLAVGQPAAPASPPPSSADPTPAATRPRPFPRVAEVEVPPELRRLGKVMGEEPLRRLCAYSASLDGYDRFGLSREALARAFPFFYALYRLYFRVRSQGHEHIPAEGPVVLVANHGGLLPFDGAMTVIDVLLNTDPPRLPRAIVERWAGTLPFVNVFFARVGQVIGTHENFDRLLRDREPVLVFPEGVEGIRKPITQRYRLQPFHVGFVEHALRGRAPVVPVAILGSDDQAPILFDVKPLAHLLGLPAAPITPTFPWLGPAGLLPYPVRYRIVYGEPVALHERFGPEGAEDASLVRALANQVRRSVQSLIDRNR
jgi:1-acyl-sn-glycerol-3-phosphate acyltransferase